MRSIIVGELIGTFILVLFGTGAVATAVLTGALQGLWQVAAVWAVAVTVAIYMAAPLSGAHLNPAVTFGLTVGGRFKTEDVPAYVAAQVLGAIVAAGVLYFIASGKAGFDLSGGFAANGYGEHSPGGYSLAAGFLCETVMTFMFLMIILGATDGRAPQGFAPLAIGFCLTLIHLISIPVTNTSVNPARSTGPALMVGGWALEQLWLFWLAPLAGAAVAGVVYRLLSEEIGS